MKTVLNLSAIFILTLSVSCSFGNDKDPITKRAAKFVTEKGIEAAEGVAEAFDEHGEKLGEAAGKASGKVISGAVDGVKEVIEDKKAGDDTKEESH
jgi:hypothetical protein